MELERPRGGTESVLDAGPPALIRMRVAVPYGDVGVLSSYGVGDHATDTAISFVQRCVEVDRVRPQRLEVECVRNETAADAENL